MVVANKRIVIGYIDSHVRISTEERFFIIEQRKKNENKEIVWVGKHYFSCLDDLLRFYIRLYLRRESKQDKQTETTLLKLLDRVIILETKIEEVGKRLQTEWENALEKTRNIDHERSDQLPH